MKRAVSLLVSDRQSPGVGAIVEGTYQSPILVQWHRGAKKRFKITATGKILRMHSGKRHLLGTKAPKRMRKLKKLTLVNKADLAKTRQMLPYGI